MLEDFRLKVFMSVAASGSFTVSARELGISQPAVSQNISAIEKETGCILFIRTRGEAVLTDEGRAFMQYAREIAYWYSAASNMFGRNGIMTSARPIRILAHPVISAYLLPQVLKVIHGAHPDLTFIVGNSGETVCTDTGEHKIPDIELTMSPSPENMDFKEESNLYGVVDAVVVSSPANRTYSGTVPMSGQSFHAKPFSTIAGIPSGNRFAVWSGYRRFLTPDMLARTVLISDSIEAIRDMTASSATLAGILPSLSIQKDIASGSLLQMPVLLPEFTFDIHLIPNPEFALHPVCRLISDTLKNNL